MSMTIPCKAVTWTGIPSFTITVEPKSQTSCWPAACSGWIATASTGCAWMPSLPCSISTTVGPRAAGSRTSTADAKISRRSACFAGSIRRCSHASPRRPRPQRNRRLGRWFRDRSTGAGWASGTNGTWGGCTTRLTTSAKTRSTAATITAKSCLACITHSSRISSCRCHTTRWCTASAQFSAACREMSGSALPICAPITASCSGIPARSSCSWGMNLLRKTNGATTILSIGICLRIPPTRECKR